MHIDPQLVQGLNDKKIAYEQLAVNVDTYSNSLRNQYRLEVNKSAISESIKAEEEIIKKLTKAQKDYSDATNAIAEAEKSKNAGRQ